MSIYLEFDDENEGDQIASSSGWGDVLRWSDTLPDGEYGEILHLMHHGWSDNPELLETELKNACEKYPPPGHDIHATMYGLIYAIEHRGDDVSVVKVTNGMGESDE